MSAGRSGGSGGFGGFTGGFGGGGGGGPLGARPRLPSPALAAGGGWAAGGRGSGGRGTGGRVLDFRRRGVPPRRKRRSLLLTLAKPLAVALSAVALPVGLTSWVLTSRRFQLREVMVEPTHRVSALWVRWALSPLAGQNLVRLSLADAAARLRRNPWVAEADLAKELPDRLRVTVRERRPAVLLESGGSLAFADASGQPIAPVGSPAEAAAARRAGLLVVAFERPAGSELEAGIAGALAVAAELGRVRPRWASGLARVDVLGEEDFRLHSTALPCPLLVARGRVGTHLARLDELLPELSRHYPGRAGIDLRLSRRIVVQPLLSPAPARGSGGA